MHLFMFFFVAILFFVLTPGIVLTVPAKSSKTTVAMVHAVIFALVWTLIHKTVWDYGVKNGWVIPSRRGPIMLEGMENKKHDKK